MGLTKEYYTSGGASMNDAEKIVEGISELRDKLQAGERIKGTRWKVCCRGYKPCSRCHGLGVYKITAELFPLKGAN